MKKSRTVRSNMNELDPEQEDSRENAVAAVAVAAKAALAAKVALAAVVESESEMEDE